jgi:hypothetical protein
VSANRLHDYEKRAKSALLLAPRKRLSRVTIELHQDEADFWSALVNWLTSENRPSTANQPFLVAKESYLFSLIEIANDQPAVWVRLRGALDKEQLVFKQPRAVDTRLSALHQDNGECGSKNWHHFLSLFTRHNQLSLSEFARYVDHPTPDWIQNYYDSLDWVSHLEKGQVKSISDQALYLALTHAIAQSLNKSEENPRWIKCLDKIPAAMRGHSSLGLLLCFERGQVWCNANLKIAPDILLAPLGGLENGIGELYWSRNYELYTAHLDEQLKRGYVAQVDPRVFIATVLRLGSMRISPPAMKFIADYIGQHERVLKDFTLTPDQVKDLSRIGVASAVLAAHPNVELQGRAEILRKDLDL